MNDRSEKLRAILLAFVMVGSVFALGLGATGSATAIDASNSDFNIDEATAGTSGAIHTVEVDIDSGTSLDTGSSTTIEAFSLNYSASSDIDGSSADLVSGVSNTDITLHVVNQSDGSVTTTAGGDLAIQSQTNSELNVSVQSGVDGDVEIPSSGNGKVIIEVDGVPNPSQDSAGTVTKIATGSDGTTSDGTPATTNNADVNNRETVSLDINVDDGSIDVAGTKYQTLHNALTDAQDGETVELSSDITLVDAFQPELTNDNLVLKGDGTLPQISVPSNGGNMAELIEVDGANNATIEALDLDGNTAGIEGIKAENDVNSGLTVVDNTIDAVTGTSVIDAGDSSGTPLEGDLNIINNTLGSNNNVDPAVTVDGENINVSENVINQVSGEGINVKDVDGNSLTLGNNSITFAGANNGIDIVTTSGNPSISITADSQNPASIGQIGGTTGGDAVEIAGITTDGGLTIDGLKVANVNQGIDVSSSDTITGDVTFTNLNLTKAGEGSSAIAYSVADSNNVGTVTLNDSLVDNANTEAAIAITSDGGGSTGADELVLENLNVSNVGASGNGEAIDVGGGGSPLADTVTISGLEFNNVGEGLDFGDSNDVLTGAAQVEVSGVTGNDLTGGNDGNFGVRLADSSARDAIVHNVTFTKSDDITAVSIPSADGTATVNVTNVDVSGVSGSKSSGIAVDIGATTNNGIVNDVTADNISQVVKVDGIGATGASLSVTNIVGSDLGDGSNDGIDLTAGARTINVQTVDIDGITGTDNGVVNINDAEDDPDTQINISGVSINNTDQNGVTVTATSGQVNTLTIDNIDVTNLTGSQAIDISAAGPITDTTISSVTATSNDAGSIRLINLASGSDTVSISDVTIDQSGTNDAIDLGSGGAVDIATSVDISNVTANNTNNGINLAGFTGSNPTVRIDNADLTNASTDAIVINSGTIDTVNVTNSVFDDNTDGVYDNANVNLGVNNNEFYAHSGNAFDGDGNPAANVNISYNYWNSTTGPTIVDPGNNRHSLGATVDISDYGTGTDITELPFTTESGEVVRAATGQLTDPSGNTINNAAVDFSLTDIDTGENKTVTFDPTSGSGEYVIVAETGTTDTATYDVTASTKGFANSDSNRFLLQSDQFLSSVDLQANNAAQVNGTVTGPSGDAVANTQLQIVNAADDSQLATATTDSNGVVTFSVSPLSGDTVYVNDTAGNLPDSSEATLTVDTGEQVNQSFTLGGQLNGTVFYPNSTVANNTDITFTANDGADDVVSTTTDENGTYTVNLTARDGDGTQSYTLQAENGSFDPSSAQTVSITEGEVASQNFTLTSLNTASLTATIENSSGDALTDTEVTLTASSDAPGSLDVTRTTDSNGEVTVRVPASDTNDAYTITADASGFTATDRGVAPAPGDSVSRTFALGNQSTSAPSPVTEGGNAPTDIDGDGTFEDVNGDGNLNIGDVQAIFQNRDSDAVQNNTAAFDYNGDGVVNIGDVQALFQDSQAA